MLHQHKFYVYKGKRKLKLLITCENFCTFCALTVFILLCKYFFREGRSGYSKHNCFCLIQRKWKKDNNRSHWPIELDSEVKETRSSCSMQLTKTDLFYLPPIQTLTIQPCSVFVKNNFTTSSCVY